MTLVLQRRSHFGRGYGDSPMCIQGLRKRQNVTARVDPVLPTQIPIRSLSGSNIERKAGNTHTFSHRLSSPGKTVQMTCFQLRFRPYLPRRKPVEVETFICSTRSTPDDNSTLMRQRMMDHVSAPKTLQCGDFSRGPACFCVFQLRAGLDHITRSCPVIKPLGTRCGET